MTNANEDMADIKTFICSLCGFKFSKEKFLNNHFNFCKDVDPADRLGPFGAEITNIKQEPCDELQSTELLDQHATNESTFDVNIELDLDFTETINSDSACPLSEEPLKSPNTGPPEEVFKCSRCEYVAAESTQLVEHTKVHEQDIKKYKCKICRFSTAHQGSLKIHIKRTHVGNLLGEVHIKKGTGNKPFECALCDYTSAYRCTVIKHIRTHTGERPFLCKFCKFASCTQSNLSAHIKRHHSSKCNNATAQSTQEKQYKCDSCDYSTTENRYLNIHKRAHARDSTSGEVRKEMGTRENPFVCTLCDYASVERSDISLHMTEAHRQEKPYVCTICNYASYAPLTVHMRSHTGERPYKCTFCNYSASQSSSLTVHLRKHTGERPFKCTLCDYASTKLAYLRVHMRRHSKEKKFKCTLCDYSFTTAYYLTVHMKMHIGETPFKCTFCDYASAQYKDLKLHLKIHM